MRAGSIPNALPSSQMRGVKSRTPLSDTVDPRFDPDARALHVAEERAGAARLISRYCVAPGRVMDALGLTEAVTA